jgi:hypothetical protein
MLLYTACVQLLLSQSAEWPWLQLLWTPKIEQTQNEL